MSIEEGMWVKVKGAIDRPMRYVTKLNDDGKTFTDDGVYSKEQPSPRCYLENYEEIQNK